MVAVAALLLAGAATSPPAAAAADAFIADLEQRLAGNGVDHVNAWLASQGPAAMAPLNQRTAACDLRAVSLSMRLNRGADARAAKAHTESLRAAAGNCTRFILGLATLEEVPRYCGSIESWSASQTARELRRRMAAIDADEVLRSSQRGRSCRAAYDHELHHTRVVLRVRP
jgi:hypothetical protein